MLATLNQCLSVLLLVFDVFADTATKSKDIQTKEWASLALERFLSHLIKN